MIGLVRRSGEQLIVEPFDVSLDPPAPMFKDPFHHPFSLSYIPPLALVKRRLTQISLGITSEAGGDRRLKDVEAKGINQFHLSDFPNIALSGTENSCRFIALRIHRLVQTIEGRMFIHRLRTLHRAVNLSMNVIANVRHVVVQCTGFDLEVMVCKVVLPQDWIEQSELDTITGIIEKIRVNQWVIGIQGDVMYEEELKVAFEELARGPMGRQILLRLNEVVKEKWQIIQQAGKFEVDTELKEIHIDSQCPEVQFGLTFRKDGSLFPLKWKLSVGVAHELLHVLYYYGQKGSGEKEVFKHVHYSSSEKRYRFNPEIRIFQAFTELEEQVVIMGLRPHPPGYEPTEIAIAHERGEGLRFSHQGTTSLEEVKYLGMPEPFALSDPLRNGELAKNDLEVAILMEDEKGIREVVFSKKSPEQLFPLIEGIISRLKESERYSLRHLEFAIKLVPNHKSFLKNV